MNFRNFVSPVIYNIVSSLAKIKKLWLLTYSQTVVWQYIFTKLKITDEEIKTNELSISAVPLQILSARIATPIVIMGET